MSEPTKDDVLAALDREIDVMGKVGKDNEFKAWTLILALVGLLGILAASWETGGQNWAQVASITLGLFMLGDIAFTLTESQTRFPPITQLFQARRLPIGIPLKPPLYGTFMVLFLFFLLIVAEELLTTWIICLAITVLLFKLFVCIVGVLLIRFTRPFSFTDTRVPKFMFQQHFVAGYVDGKVHGAKGGKAYGKLIEPVLEAVVAVATFAVIFPITPGAPLTNIRFAFLVYAAFCVLSAIIQPAPMRSLPSLIVLRRGLLGGDISPRDAYDGLSLAQGGVDIAPQIVLTKQNVATIAKSILAEIHNEPELLEQYIALEPADRIEHPLGKMVKKLEMLIFHTRADIHVQIALYPNTDLMLIGILQQMEESLNELREIVDPSLDNAKPSSV